MRMCFPPSITCRVPLEVMLAFGVSGSLCPKLKARSSITPESSEWYSKASRYRSLMTLSCSSMNAWRVVSPRTVRGICVEISAVRSIKQAMRSEIVSRTIMMIWLSEKLRTAYTDLKVDALTILGSSEVDQIPLRVMPEAGQQWGACSCCLSRGILNRWLIISSSHFTIHYASFLP